MHFIEWFKRWHDGWARSPTESTVKETKLDSRWQLWKLQSYHKLCGNFKVLEIYISKSYKCISIIYTIINSLLWLAFVFRWNHVKRYWHYTSKFFPKLLYDCHIIVMYISKITKWIQIIKYSCLHFCFIFDGNLSFESGLNSSYLDRDFMISCFTIFFDCAWTQEIIPS